MLDGQPRSLDHSPGSLDLTVSYLATCNRKPENLNFQITQARTSTSEEDEEEGDLREFFGVLKKLLETLKGKPSSRERGEKQEMDIFP